MKSNTTTLIYWGVFSLLLWSQCTPTLYIHNTLNTPLPAKKGDFKASYGTIGPSSYDGTTLEFQGSYALTDKVAVLGNVLTMDWTKKNEVLSGRHRLFELGAGRYFTFWNNEQGFPMGRAEVMGGIGFGSGFDNNIVPNIFRENQFDYRAGYQRLYVQPAAGIRISVLDATLALRSSYVHFSKYEKLGQNNGVLEKDRFGFATIEPAVTLSIGYKYVKIYTQMRAVQPLANSDNWLKVTDIDLTPLSIGLVASSWQEKRRDRPAVVVKTPPAQPGQHASKPEQAPVVEPSAADSVSVLLPVAGPMTTICIRDAGAPDEDIVSLSFNGVYIFQNTTLGRKFLCVDVQIVPDMENVLRIHGISEGKTTPITMEVVIRDGKIERSQYLRIKAGQTEELRMVAD